MPSPITDELLDALAMVESGNNPRAIGDTKLQNYAVGAFQMRRPAFEDVQRLRPQYRKRWFEELTDDPAFQREMARNYLEVLNQNYGFSTLEDILSGYNAGPTATRRGKIPASTQDYINRVKGFLGRRRENSPR